MSTSVQPTNHVPEPVARVAELMATYGGAWAICGGWAVDAWLGRPTRDHADVDIAVFQGDERALLDHLTGWQLIAHDTNVDGGTSELWDGRRLDLPGHIHGRLSDERLPDRVDAATEQGFGLDIQLSERSDADWVFSREPRVTMPLHRAIVQSAWGLPTLAPEALLFYKGGDLRRRDKLDFLALLPHLTAEQRGWLREAISLVGHPWLAQLS